MLSRWSATIAALCLCACSSQGARDEPRPAAPTPHPAAQPSAQKPATQESSACQNPAPVSLELEAGTAQQTPWGLSITYAVDEDKLGHPGFMFLLNQGERRWETRRDEGNWNTQMMWRGFCWRGVGRPEHRANHLQIQVAPVCEDGRLIEIGGCRDTFRSR